MAVLREHRYHTSEHHLVIIKCPFCRQLGTVVRTCQRSKALRKSRKVCLQLGWLLLAHNKVRERRRAHANAHDASAKQPDAACSALRQVEAAGPAVKANSHAWTCRDCMDRCSLRLHFSPCASALRGCDVHVGAFSAHVVRFAW